MDHEISSFSSIRSFLLAEFDKRKKEGPGYSLRSFARSLNINPTTLSQVMNEKREISKLNLDKICEALGLSEDSKNRLYSLQASFKYEARDEDRFQILKEDAFISISKWYHHGILGLALLENNSSDPKWIARRLGITEAEATDALQRLMRLELIRLVGGKLTSAFAKTRTSTDIPSSAIKSFHKQVMSLATQSLDQDSVDVRDMSTSFLPFRPDEIKKAKIFIKKMRRGFCSKFEKKSGSEVYALSVQLFPITKRTQK